MFTYGNRVEIRPSFADFQTVFKGEVPVCAEIGVFEGANAVNMLNLDERMLLYLIDPYEVISKVTGGSDFSSAESENILFNALGNLAPFSDRITWIRKTSQEASLDFPPEFFDYIYIDGDHLYETVKKDMELWYPKLKVGGVFGGHDIVDPGVRRAFYEFVDKLGITKRKVTVGRGLSDWSIIKP